MFQLHDTTRRRIGLGGFVLFGILPALVIGVWCAMRHAPAHVRAEAREIGQKLGLDVKIAGLQHLRPGVVLYEGLEAADPETGLMIFRCRLLEVSSGRQTDTQGQSRPTLVLTAAQPEVEAAAMHRIGKWLEWTLQGFSGPLESDVQFSATELTIRAAKGAQDSQTLADVKGAVESLSGGMHARLDFRLAGAETPEPAYIHVTRNRQVSPPASGFELYTGDGEMPCNVLAAGMAEWKPLGSRCRFRGRIWANETPGGWDGEINGQLLDLDLGELITDHFPHRLSGTGAATIQSARFRGGRLVEGAALVTVGPGVIDRSLAASAVERLGLTAAGDLSSAGRNIPFDQLAFLATIDARGLQLQGRCAAGEKGAILQHNGRCLLGEPRQPASIAALVRTLAPDSMIQVPASRQTDWLLDHLPLLDAIPPAETESVAPNARVRIHDTRR
jgi:hypothetical protein